MSSIVVTVGVPTFDRGRCARELVEELLPRLPAGAILWVSDNASTREARDYDLIRQYAEAYPAKLVYTRNEQNVNFLGNFKLMLEHCQTPWLMYTSDEDRPSPAYIERIVTEQADNPSIGIFRGSVVPGTASENSFKVPNARLKGGLEALNRFGFHNTYLSGTAYHCGNLRRKGIIERFLRGVDAHVDYPHLYLDALTTALLDVEMTEMESCREGTADPEIGGRGDLYQRPYTVGARLDQFWLTRSAVFEALDSIEDGVTQKDLVETYANVCNIYLRLCVEVNGPVFKRYGLDVASVARCASEFFKAAIPTNQSADLHINCLRAIDRLTARYLQSL